LWKYSHCEEDIKTFQGKNILRVEGKTQIKHSKANQQELCGMNTSATGLLLGKREFASKRQSQRQPTDAYYDKSTIKVVR